MARRLVPWIPRGNGDRERVHRRPLRRPGMPASYADYRSSGHVLRMEMFGDVSDRAQCTPSPGIAESCMYQRIERSLNDAEIQDAQVSHRKSPARQPNFRAALAVAPPGPTHRSRSDAIQLVLRSFVGDGRSVRRGVRGGHGSAGRSTESPYSKPNDQRVFECPGCYRSRDSPFRASALLREVRRTGGRGRSLDVSHRRLHREITCEAPEVRRIHAPLQVRRTIAMRPERRPHGQGQPHRPRRRSHRGARARRSSPADPWRRLRHR